MQKREQNATARLSGNALQPLSGVTVSVVDDATGLPAALYSDNGVTLITAPIVTDSNGYYGYYAADGKYTETFTGSRVATPITRKVTLEDPDDNPAASLSQLAAAGGGALVGAMASGSGAVLRTQQDKAREFVSVKDYGAVGNGVTDDTTAFTNAFAAARKVFVPAGTYILANAILPANTELFGEGDATILKMVAASSDVLRCDSGSASVSNNIKNITIRDMQFLATCDVDGFSEQKHLVRVNGVTNFRAENVLFKGFRGDGLYIGSGYVAAQERHNQNVHVINCRFDGINNANRNGISFIDIDGFVVDRCEFKNVSSATMPGPIDFEPDSGASYAIVRNGVVRDCVFSACGGNAGEIGIYIPSAVTLPPRNIKVIGNTSTGYVGTGAFFLNRTDRAPTATSEENNIQLTGNTVKGGYRPFNLIDGKRIIVRDNTFIDCTRAALIGASNAANTVRDAILRDNQLIRCGSVDGNGIAIGNANYLTFQRNKLIDCGSGAPGAANGIIFASSSASSYVSFFEDEISTPTAMTLIGIQKEASHTLSPETNKFNSVNMNSLSVAFTAVESDSLLTSWTPFVEGASTVGTGAYIEQTGKVYKRGKTVCGSLRVAVSAGHTGTGLIEVSLPYAASTSNVGAGGLVTMGSASVNGLAVSGGVTARLNPAATANGVQGAFRIYFGATGTLSQATIPAGAFDIEFSFSYLTT